MNSAPNTRTRNFARPPVNASNLNHSNASQVYSNRAHLGGGTPSSRLPVLCQQRTLTKRKKSSCCRSSVNQISRCPHINSIASDSADISLNAQQLSTGHTVSTSSSTSEESSTILNNTPNLFPSITGDHHIHNLAGEPNEKKHIKRSRLSKKSTTTMAIEQSSGHSDSSTGGIPLDANDTGNNRRSRIGASRRRSARLQRLRSQGLAHPSRNNLSTDDGDVLERNMHNRRNQNVDVAATLNVPLSNLHNDSITAIPLTDMNASSSLPEVDSISRMNRSMASGSPGDLHDGKSAILDSSDNKVEENKKKSKKKKKKHQKSTHKVPEASNAPLSEGKERAPDCCICLEQPAKEELSKLDGCGHLYCFSCIDEWSKRENTCPQCKSRFTQIERVHKVASRKRRGDNSLQNPRNVKKVANRTQRANIPSQQQQSPLNIIDHHLFHRLNGFSLAINNTFHDVNVAAPRQANATAAILAAENAAMVAANATMNSIAASLLATSRSTSRLNVAPMGSSNTAPPVRMTSTISSPLGNSGMTAGSSHSSPLVHQTIRLGVSQLISSQLHLSGTGMQGMNVSHNASLSQAMLPPGNTPPVHTIRMRISQYINQSNAPIQPHVVREIFASTGRTLGGTQNLAYPGISSNTNLHNWPNLNPNMTNVATTATHMAYPSDYPQGGYGSLPTHRNAGSSSRGFHFGASPLQQPPELPFLGGSGIPSSSVRREMMSAPVATRPGLPLNHEGNLPSTVPGLFVVGTSTTLTPNSESRTVGTSTFSSIPFAANGNEHRR